MRANIVDLIKIQREVNEKVKEKLETGISGDQFILAFNIELFEFFNEVGTWKWWKHSHEPKKEKVLDELADCFAFFLSAIDLESDYAILEGEDNFIQKTEEEINIILEKLNSFKVEMNDNIEAINELIVYVGTDNEISGILTIERFAIAVFIATLLYPDIIWDELADAYRKKSKVNIERQEEGY